MQVAFDLASVGQRDVDRASLRLAERVDPLLERLGLARTEPPPRGRGVDAREAADDPRDEREKEQTGDKKPR